MLSTNLPIYETLSVFLLKHLNPASSQRVLLALSGGPDSLTLFHLLLEFQKHHVLQLAIAHVDHQWRQESAQEAAHIQKMAECMGLPVHLKVLEPSKIEGNLEMACRQERIRFFCELAQKHSYQAVLLGHHADDQAETVLKRLLEGAPLPALQGIQPVTIIDDVPFWRPLLCVPKKEIELWLSEFGQKPFYDYTNFDPQFLRGRMRTQLIPQLTQHFGKEVCRALCRIGHEASELQEYLQQRTKEYLDRLDCTPWGIMLDFTDCMPEAAVELKFLLREACRKVGFVIPHTLVSRVCKFIVDGDANRSTAAGQFRIYVDRRRLFVMPKDVPTIPTHLHPFEEGSFTYGPWNVTIRLSNGKQYVSGWKSVWEGYIETCIPASEDLSLGPAKPGACYPGNSSIAKWWCDHKIPAFLRGLVPVVWQGDRIVHEFLTSRTTYQNEETANQWHIQMRY